MFKIEFAGTGGALPLKNRNLSSAVLSYDGRKLLLDCGEGTQKSLLHLHTGFVNIDIICLSHLHGDHIFGLPGLLCTMGMAKRTNDLLILAPKGSRNLLSQFICLVGRQSYGIYVLEMDGSFTPSDLYSRGPLALVRTSDGYKISLALSDPQVINAAGFYCLLSKKTDELCKSTDLPPAAEQDPANTKLETLFPECNLFYQQQTPAALQKQSRLQKQLSRYENLSLTLEPDFPADLYINAAAQKHSVPCLGFRFDFYQSGKFSSNKAMALGIFQGFWSFLQQGYHLSYRYKGQDYEFSPHEVLGESRHKFSLAYVTDTRPLAYNNEFLRAVEVLISESNYALEDKLPLAVKNRHMTMKEACLQAANAQVKALILTHFSASLIEPETYLDYARSFFQNSYIARDLDTFILTDAAQATWQQISAQKEADYEC